MTDQQPTEQEYFAYDTLAGPIFSFRVINQADVSRLSAGRDQPQIIEMLVFPYPEFPGQRPELRHYYCLNLPQAVARATELEIRLKEQERTAVLTGLRPATNLETNDFFRAMAVLESQMPGSIPAHVVRHERSGLCAPNSSVDGHEPSKKNRNA